MFGAQATAETSSPLSSGKESSATGSHLWWSTSNSQTCSVHHSIKFQMCLHRHMWSQKQIDLIRIQPAYTNEWTPKDDYSISMFKIEALFNSKRTIKKILIGKPEVNRYTPSVIHANTINWVGNSANPEAKDEACTFAQFSAGVFDLKPKTKLDCRTSLLCGFHEMDADKQETLPNLDTKSITFWNSACRLKNSSNEKWSTSAHLTSINWQLEQKQLNLNEIFDQLNSNCKI